MSVAVQIQHNPDFLEPGSIRTAADTSGMMKPELEPSLQNRTASDKPLAYVTDPACPEV